MSSNSQQTSDLTKRKESDDDDDEEYREYECKDSDTLEAVRLHTVTSIDAMKKSMDVTNEKDIECFLKFANWNNQQAIRMLHRRASTSAKKLKEKKPDSIQLELQLTSRKRGIARNFSVIKEEYRRKKLKIKNDD